MAKYYCPSCGGETEYTFNIPAFCSKCGTPKDGTSFAAAPTIKPKPIATASPRPLQRPLRRPEPIQYEEEYVEIPDIEQLEITVSGLPPQRGVKLGEVAVGRPEPSYRPKGKKTSEKKFLKELEEEAGSGRRQSIDVGGGAVGNED